MPISKGTDPIGLPGASRQASPGRPWRGLIQLFAASVVPLSLLLILLAFGSAWLHQTEMRQLVEVRDVRAAVSGARSLQAMLRTRLDLLSAYYTAGDTLPAAADALSRAGWDAGAAWLAPRGKIYPLAGAGAARFHTLPVGFPLAEGGASIYPETIPDPLTGRPVALGAIPAEGGYLVAGLFADTLAESALQAMVGSAESSRVFLADATGRSLYSAGRLPAALPSEDHPAVLAAQQEPQGSLLLQTGEGERVAAYARVEDFGWTVVLEESWEPLVSPYLRTTLAAPLALAPILAVTVLALVYGTRQVIRPLQSLQSKATDLAWGRFDAMETPVGGIEEIRRLQAEMAGLARKVRGAQQGLRGYIGAITEAQEEERRRLARELHDDTLQSLIALHQRLQILRPAPDDSAATRAWEEIQVLTRETIDELRRTTRALRPAYLEELGLVSALEALAGETSKTAKIAVEFHIRGEARRLPPETELTLYRMAQESLHNTLRHASAAHAFVDLVFEAGRTELHILDDGQGFDPPESPTDLARLGHFGLMGLQERAELIGALLSIRSSPGQGTQIGVVLPNPLPRSQLETKHNGLGP